MQEKKEYYRILYLLKIMSFASCLRLIFINKVDFACFREYAIFTTFEM
jgi:hypothetical protein